MAQAGKVGALYRLDQNVAGVAFANEATTDSGDGKRFQITDANKRYWSKADPVTVKVGGVVRPNGFTIEHLSGFVVFDAAPGGAVTVSGKYVTLVQVAGAYGWKVDEELGVEEATTFLSGGNREYEPTLHGWSGSADQYWIAPVGADVTKTAHAAMLSGELIFVLYEKTSSGARLEGYGKLTKIGRTVPNGALVDEALEFQGSGPLWER